MSKTNKKKEIEGRRKLVENLLKKGKSRKEIARKLHISLSTLSIDIKSLEIERAAKEEEAAKKRQAENLPEGKYKKMMMGKIVDFYAERKIEKAKEYLRMLESEIELSITEKENLYKILKGIQEQKREQAKRRDKKENNENEVSSR